MNFEARIEGALEATIQRASMAPCPPQLGAAMRHSVFPGGARVRPKLLLAVAEACGGDDPALADAAAAAIELLHCASLVHDDLPCFDDAGVRRGQPSVHAVYGTPIALLAGDGLIVSAFDCLARGAKTSPLRLGTLLGAITRGVAGPAGIVAGQAWESEPNPPPEQYRCMKTGALFIAATTGGAIASGGDPTAWRMLGHRLGEAYQVADDLLDAVTDAADADKPVGRDAALGRPSAVTELGVAGAVAKLKSLVDDAIASIPKCRGEAELREMVRAQAMRLTPKNLARFAA